MSLVPWRRKSTDVGPAELSPFVALRTEMDRLFDSFTRGPLGALDWPFSGRVWGPALDVTENDQEIVVRAELPGMDPKEVEVTLTGNQLVLAGEKKQAEEKEEQGAYLSECCYGSFRRAVQLPAEVDPDSVSAEYVNGVFSIRMKKSAASKARRIEVKTT